MQVTRFSKLHLVHLYNEAFSVLPDTTLRRINHRQACYNSQPGCQYNGYDVTS